MTPNRAPTTNQQGVAAIEFAISITLVLMLFFGIVTYGALFWTQQKVSQLAAEAGRYAVAVSMRQISDTLDDAVCTQHIETIKGKDLLLSSLPTGEAGAASAQLCKLIVSPCTATQGETRQCATITITADGAQSWPLIKIMYGLAGVFTSTPDTLIPNKLTSTAVVQIM